MQLGRGELFKPFDDRDSAVREARFRYFTVFTEYEPEVIAGLKKNCSHLYEMTGIHSYELLVELLEGKADKHAYSSYHFEPYRHYYVELRERIDRWYQEFHLERFGEWCKDIGLALLSDMSEAQEGTKSFTGSKYLFHYASPTDPVLKGVPDFYSYLVSRRESEERRIGPRFPGIFRYNPSKISRKKFKQLISNYIQEYVDDYTKMVEEQALSRGFVGKGHRKRQTRFAKKKRQTKIKDYPAEHFHWLYLRHIRNRTCDAIATAAAMDKEQPDSEGSDSGKIELTAPSPQYICDTTNGLAKLVVIPLGTNDPRMKDNRDIKSVVDARLSDEQWKKVKPFLPPQPALGRRRKQDREVLNSLVYRFRTSCRYRDVPRAKGYASPSTTHHWESRWVNDGVFHQMWRHLLEVLDDEGQLKLREEDFDGSSITNKRG